MLKKTVGTLISAAAAESIASASNELTGLEF